MMHSESSNQLAAMPLEAEPLLTDTPRPGKDRDQVPSPPQILAPEPGDTVGSPFTVSGVYSTDGKTVTVSVGGASPSSQSATVSGGVWATGNFTASPGEYTAYASVTGGPSSSVTFTVSGDPPIDFDGPPEVEPEGDGLTGEDRAKKKVIAKGSYTPSTETAITAVLQSSDGTYSKTLPAEVNTDKKTWSVTFHKVPSPGQYFVRVTLLAGGVSTSTSYIVPVK